MAQPAPISPAPFSPPPGPGRGGLRLTEDGGDQDREAEIQQRLNQLRQGATRLQNQGKAPTQEGARTPTTPQPRWMNNFNNPNQSTLPQIQQAPYQDYGSEQEDEADQGQEGGEQEQMNEQGAEQGGQAHAQEAQDQQGQKSDTETDRSSALNRVRNKASQAAQQKLQNSKTVNSALSKAGAKSAKGLIPGTRMFLWEQMGQLLVLSPFAYVYIHVHFLADYFKFKFIIEFEEPDAIQKIIFYVLLFIEITILAASMMIPIIIFSFVKKFAEDPLFAAGIATDAVKAWYQTINF